MCVHVVLCVVRGLVVCLRVVCVGGVWCGVSAYACVCLCMFGLCMCVSVHVCVLACTCSLVCAVCIRMYRDVGNV